ASKGSPATPIVHPFPTRRSSDLAATPRAASSANPARRRAGRGRPPHHPATPPPPPAKARQPIPCPSPLLAFCLSVFFRQPQHGLAVLVENADRGFALLRRLDDDAATALAIAQHQHGVVFVAGAEEGAVGAEQFAQPCRAGFLGQLHDRCPRLFTRGAGLEPE